MKSGVPDPPPRAVHLAFQDDHKWSSGRPPLAYTSPASARTSSIRSAAGQIRLRRSAENPFRFSDRGFGGYLLWRFNLKFHVTTEPRYWMHELYRVGAFADARGYPLDRAKKHRTSPRRKFPDTCLQQPRLAVPVANPSAASGVHQIRTSEDESLVVAPTAPVQPVSAGAAPINEQRNRGTFAFSAGEHRIAIFFQSIRSKTSVTWLFNPRECSASA